VFQFWAKTDETTGALRAHSVPHHCLDVAASAHTLLPYFPPPVTVPPEAIVALVALHDVGKFSRTFQAKAPALWPTSALGPLTNIPPEFHHVQVGYEMLSDQLEALVAPLFNGWLNSSRQPVLRAVAGHHGSPPLVTGQPTPGPVVCADCLAAALKFTRSVFSLLNPPSLPKLSSRERQALVWWLAGFTNLADWVGSRRDWFPTVDAATHTDLAAYWAQACAQAERAVREAGLVPSVVSANTGMGALFPAISNPRPLQRWAETTPIPDGPCLFIIEDATGSGKTESALTLAHRLMDAGRGAGLYVALPTMATSNAMYGRLSEAYRRLFVADARPSLVLAHGRRNLNDNFTDSILDAMDDDDPAVAQCAEWIADNKKRSFLAEVGVGTVDQALLSILPVRHAMMRLLGVSQRVLVIDEAHAYDAYMGIELSRLLEFHAALGGSAIVLSATLTARQRADLADAFRTGLGVQGAAAVPAIAAYPAATTVSAAGVVTQPVALIDPALYRSVTVERVPTRARAADKIVIAAQAGAAVAWVRNTVNDAIEATELLTRRGLQPILFHARFAAGDRLNVEHEVLKIFGPNSTPAERNGRVLVATQVVEQSLDLDFDLMVSDVAPADLVIQRAGRLWRHPWRGARPVPTARLLLLSPPPVANPPPGWMGDAKTRFVYQNPAVLWRSACALLTDGNIVTPTNIRTLVEAAYDDSNTPPGLTPASNRAVGNEGRARGTAHQNVLDFGPRPYDRSAGRWEPDEHTPTRLGEAYVTIRLARYMRGRLMPWCSSGGSAYRDWQMSEVSIRASRVLSVINDPRFVPALTTLRAHWPRWDQETPVLVLRPINRTTWCGRVLDQRGRVCGVTYTKETGWNWD
jgi:CRISPR-associated endonuclease/helicase Cas3